MKITYLFVTGRKSRIENIDTYAREMFYGYDYFASKYQDTKIIELHDRKQFSNKLYFFIDRVINKLTVLPFNMNNVTSKENLNIIFRSDHLIISNDRLAFSSLPMILLSKIMRKKVKVTFFAMGLFAERKRNIFQKILSKQLLKTIFKYTDNVVFLGKIEYEIANKKFSKFKEKFHFIPFAVDYDFWKINKEHENIEKEHILFVGNDTNREFEKMVQIASILKDKKFTFVSKHYRIKNIKVELDNVEIIDGSWGNQKISDIELKQLYQESKLVVIPLKESNQPSGQSVTLQSMSCGTPVMITKTKGFWDPVSYSHLKNIYFVENNTVDNWVRAINEVFDDDSLLNKISNNGLQTIELRYTLHNFNKKIENIIKT